MGSVCLFINIDRLGCPICNRGYPVNPITIKGILKVEPKIVNQPKEEVKNAGLQEVVPDKCCRCKGTLLGDPDCCKLSCAHYTCGICYNIQKKIINGKRVVWCFDCKRSKKIEKTGINNKTKMT